jgi:DegV family protein with EDD domain
MPGISVITDTDSSLPLELAAHFNITQVPMTINFGEDSYEAVYAISDSDTFRRIDKECHLPTTAAPSPGKYINAYKNAFAAGADQIVCLCVSSEVSATYRAALSACEDFQGRDIRVIDSRSLSMGL